MHRHAAALICIIGTWFPLQMGTSLQRAISPGCLFCDTAYNCQGKKMDLNLNFLEHCSVSTEWIFSTIFSLLLAGLECKWLCALWSCRSPRRQKGSCATPLVPVLTGEFYTFFLFVLPQYSTYLLQQIFETPGLLAAADSFILMELESLPVKPWDQCYCLPAERLSLKQRSVLGSGAE